MEEIKLTCEQNVRAAIVFLNIFDLYVEEKRELLAGDTLKIMKPNTKPVGSISFEENKVNITAQTAFGLLDAFYVPTKAIAFVDYESIGYPKHAFWNTEINYSINSIETMKFSGLCDVKCFMDTEYGIDCYCRPLLEFWIRDKKVMSLMLQRDGKVFGLELMDNDITESIEINPHDEVNGYFNHIITKAKTNKNDYLDTSISKVVGHKTRSQTKTNNCLYFCYEVWKKDSMGF